MAIDKSIMPPAEATEVVQAGFDYVNELMPFNAVMPMRSNDGEWTVSWAPRIPAKGIDRMQRRALDAEIGHVRTQNMSEMKHAGLLPLSGMDHISERDMAKHASDAGFIHERATEKFTNLGQMAAVTLELNRIDAMVNGAISVNENGAKAKYTFGRPSSQDNVAPTTLWDVAASDPVGDIEKWRETIRKAGGRTPRAALTTTSVIDALRTNESMRTYQSGTSLDYSKTRLSRQEVLDVLAQQAGLTDIRMVDDLYEGIELDNGIKMNVDLASVIPAKTFLLFPSYNDPDMGFTADGPTAEGANEEYGLNKTVNQGMVGVMVYHEAPSNYDLWANGSAMPILVEPVSTFRANVLA